MTAKFEEKNESFQNKKETESWDSNKNCALIK